MPQQREQVDRIGHVPHQIAMRAYHRHRLTRGQRLRFSLVRMAPGDQPAARARHHGSAAEREHQVVRAIGRGDACGLDLRGTQPEAGAADVDERGHVALCGAAFEGGDPVDVRLDHQPSAHAVAGDGRATFAAQAPFGHP